MPLTGAQSAAVTARGNLIVVAGAGTGKTSTLIERCLTLLRGEASLDRILMVTFTEAAASEMRHRLRVELQELAAVAEEPVERERFAGQLALVETAGISTIHGFCLRLVQAHFHELGLDPDIRVLEDAPCRVLARSTLDALMEDCFSGIAPASKAVQALVSAYAPDRDGLVRELVLKVHRYTQAIPDADRWLEAQQAKWKASAPHDWESQLIKAFQDWRCEWLPALEAQAAFKNIGDCLRAVQEAGTQPDRSSIHSATQAILNADAAEWNRKKGIMRKPFEKFFDEAGFLTSVAAPGSLEADWQAVRGHMGAILELSAEFTSRFTRAKRELGGVDFPDLEQLALKLLLQSDGTLSDVAREWQQRLDFVFVDECQDINRAQDAILSAVSRSGPDANRFLVGDAKQSIYQFRLADPEIFRHYEQSWAEGDPFQRIVLAENFRSRPGILAFVNVLFPPLMREHFGGVPYEPLEVGAEPERADDLPSPCVEVHLILRTAGSSTESPDEAAAETADLSDTEREAHLIVGRLQEMERQGLAVWDRERQCERKFEWRDVAILMRSPRPRTEVFAKVFHQAGIPMSAERAGFLDAIEVSDLVCLLKILDNPLQDVPLLAVLRSPLVRLTLDDLTRIRVESQARPFWLTLRAFAHSSTAATGGDAVGPGGSERLRGRVTAFLEQLKRWRDLVREVGPSICLETVLAETDYDVLLQGNERSGEKMANVRRLLDLARQFDPFLRQGLYRFLRYLRSLDEAGDTLEPAPLEARNAVRLMSIHKSKGLEFPVVVLAGMGTRFNLQDLHSVVLFDPESGLAPKAMLPNGAGRYPTLPHWVAARRQRVRQLGEELRLLYVAATRARDRLICTGTLNRVIEGRWHARPENEITRRDLASACCPLDWLMAWLPGVTRESDWKNETEGESDLMAWKLWDPADPQLKTQPRESQAEKGAELESVADPQTVAGVATRLSTGYPHAAAISEPAKSSVSRIRSRAAELLEEDAVRRFDRGPSSARRGSRGPGGRKASLSAAERGTLHHRFLQCLSLEAAMDRESLGEELNSMVERGLFSPEERVALDLDSIAGFWSSEVGSALRAHAEDVSRELPFTARFEDAELRQWLGQPPEPALSGEFVVVQGVVDLAVFHPHEIWILDFKTDEVAAGEVATRVGQYRPQLELYAIALERIHGMPVRHRWLHFLNAGQTVDLA